MTALPAVAWWIAVVSTAYAGVVEGVVIENASGRPMARTSIELQPVPRSGGDSKPLSVRAGIAGHFVFPAVADGLYLLTAKRPHYFPASFGQRLPGGEGTPITVTRDSNLFTELRMRRMGAITGRILDENGIGLSDADVVAYRARLPLRIAAQAVSDDRGVYRIHGLDPGKYWVRTGPITLEDASGMLPVFAPEAGESRDARVYPVAVDAETTDADIHPPAGSLLRLNVYPQCQPLGAPVMLFVSSETGRRTQNANCGDPKIFDGLAPGAYEIYAETSGGIQAGFVEMFLTREERAIVLMGPPPRVLITVEGGGPNARSTVSLKARRQDLAAVDTERDIKTAQMTLAPGNWEISAKTAPGDYVQSITTAFGAPRRPWRRERVSDRYEIFVDARQQAWIKVALSDKAGHIAGTVQEHDQAVPGIPVFLWPVAEQARRALGGAVRMLSDVNGAVQFDSLPPGDYRMLATFDLNEADEDAMEAAQAPAIHIEPLQTVTPVLKPWQAPF